MGNSKSNHNDLVLREMPQKVRELHYAVMSNDRETVRLLIQQGVNVNFPWYNPSNPSIKDGSTPLICAVSLNHTEIVEVSNCFSFESLYSRSWIMWPLDNSHNFRVFLYELSGLHCTVRSGQFDKNTLFFCDDGAMNSQGFEFDSQFWNFQRS